MSSSASQARRRILVLPLCLVFWLGLWAPAFAQSATSSQIDGVVELFTSQGCSSCPQADTVLSELADDDRLLTLSYHVEYWDYIGWKDPLGSARNTERQRAYAKAMGHRSIFTPQVVVNGVHDLAASDPQAIESVLGEEKLSGRSHRAALHLSKKGSTLQISAQAPATATAGRQAVLILVTYRSKTETDVERGENAGQHLVSSHAVRDWQVVGTMSDTPIELDMPIAPLIGTEGGATNFAVLLQVMEEDGSSGPILAAAKLAL